MTLLVDLEERWLADVGFGDSFREPLRLDEPDDQVQDGRAYRVVHDGVGGTMLSGDRDGAVKGYRFSLRPRALADYSGRCHYLQTSPNSSFTQRIVCSRAMPTGRVTIADQRLIVTDGTERSERALSEAEWRAALIERFGIPPDDARALRRRVAAAERPLGGG